MLRRIIAWRYTAFGFMEYRHRRYSAPNATSAAERLCTPPPSRDSSFGCTTKRRREVSRRGTSSDNLHVHSVRTVTHHKGS